MTTSRLKSGKVALVTGAAQGIGRGCAQALARSGFALALVDVLTQELARTATEIRESGVDVLTFEADVTDYERAHTVVRETVSHFGRVDFLLNNAGKSMPAGILDITEAEFDRTLSINLKSCFNYIRAVAPVMLGQGGGRIVSMSSLNAHSGGVTAAVSRFAYAAAKAGILGLTRALAKELGPTILVNAICPGMIETELTKHVVLSERGADLVRNGIALHRVGTTDDIAQLVVFLAMSEPCFITGQDFVVDGLQYHL